MPNKSTSAKSYWTKSICVTALVLFCSVAGPEQARTQSASSDTTSQVSLTGVNLAGAEFNTKALPGRASQDYIYPDTDEITYFTDLGVNIFRLPFRWERLQAQPFAHLNKKQLSLIDKVVKESTKRNAHVILDLHNYGSYFGHPVGSEQVAVDAFTDIWSKLAVYFKDNDKVIFGLMNEPVKIPAHQWRQVIDQTLLAIRATGAKNLILIPGIRWTGAHSWKKGTPGTSNSEILMGISDPADNFAIEVHQYLDQDYSGRSPICRHPSVGSEKLRFFTDWARHNSYKAFLGEFAAAANDTCLMALKDMLDYMDENADIWLGWTIWAAGPWWPETYPFKLHPKVSNSGSDKDRPQISILERYWARNLTSR